MDQIKYIHLNKFQSIFETGDSILNEYFFFLSNNRLDNKL